MKPKSLGFVFALSITIGCSSIIPPPPPPTPAADPPRVPITYDNHVVQNDNGTLAMRCNNCQTKPGTSECARYCAHRQGFSPTSKRDPRCLALEQTAPTAENYAEKLDCATVDWLMMPKGPLSLTHSETMKLIQSEWVFFVYASKPRK